jgi:hypothetical protein
VILPRRYAASHLYQFHPSLGITINAGSGPTKTLAMLVDAIANKIAPSENTHPVAWPGGANG